MAASLLIYLYVQRELNYDMFHSKSERIHRVLLDKSLGVSNTYAGITFVAMAPEIPKDIPEVEEAVRIMGRGRQPISVGEQRFNTPAMAFADPSIFKIFDFVLTIGNPETALQEPYTAVLSREQAEILFGSRRPDWKNFYVRSGRDPGHRPACRHSQSFTFTVRCAGLSELP